MAAVSGAVRDGMRDRRSRAERPGGERAGPQRPAGRRLGHRERCAEHLVVLRTELCGQRDAEEPPTAASIVNGGGREFQANLTSGQAISTADALLVADEQTVLQVGTFLIVLLALASVALLAGGRMIEQTRRV